MQRLNLSTNITKEYTERWYDAARGNITRDGIPVQQLNLTWLRTNIRLVQQEPVLLSGTIFENVACGLFGTEKAKLPESEQRALVEQACKDAYADEFIERLPKVRKALPILKASVELTWIRLEMIC